MNRTPMEIVASLNQTAAMNKMYNSTIFAAAVTLIILSPITVLTNVLLLTSIAKDPLKLFNRPTKYFVIGLSVADLLCGMTVEPFFAVDYLARYFEANVEFQAISRLLFVIGSSMANLSLNASFMMVLMLSVVHFIVVHFPYRYKSWVKKKRVLSCVLLTWLYFAFFSVLPLVGVDQLVFFKINLTLHSTPISVVLIIIHITTVKSYTSRSLHKKTKQLKSSASMSRSESQAEAGGKKHGRKNGLAHGVEKSLLIMTFYLAVILLFAAFPHIIVFCVFLFAEIPSREQETYLNIALRVTDLFLFAKVAVDAFIFAWRLPTYRKSLVTIMKGKMPDITAAV